MDFRFALQVLGLCLALMLNTGNLQAQEVQPVPALSGHVVDRSGTLSASDLSAMEQQLAAIEQRTGAQVVLLMVPSTAPEDIFDYANRVANVWKIGRKAVGDGVLVVVAVQDHRLRIEVAKTLEGAIPDLAASQIIERDMTPAFKRGDHATGLRQGIEALGQRIAGENLPAPEPVARGADRSDVWSILLIALLVASQVVRSVVGRGKGAALMGIVGAGLAYVVTASGLIALGAGLVALLWTLLGGLRASGLPSGRGGGGWGGMSGGGGFSSGGGGDFGGGGASGRW
jgi:uncharacterized protein